MKNAMTIDVEDYFQVSAFENIVNIDDWDAIAPRVERNTQLLLEKFARFDIQATFFTLGWVAKKFPGLIRDIVNQGHELASHGTLHQRASDQDRNIFKSDVGDAKRLLEDIGGVEVIGYRAPSFSFTKNNEWVYDVLAEEGYKYSSSVYPVVHDHYGIPDAPRFQYTTKPGVLEIPLSTLPVFGKNVPISGGGYFRLYPYMMTRWAISKFILADNQPYIFYLHPWEMDPAQPRMKEASLKSRFRHYLNLRKVDRRLSALLTDFEWSSMAEIYGFNNVESK